MLVHPLIPFFFSFEEKEKNIKAKTFRCHGDGKKDAFWMISVSACLYTSLRTEASCTSDDRRSRKDKKNRWQEVPHKRKSTTT
jgi:hypothetical protein